MDVKQILYEFTGEAKQLETTLESIRAHVKSLPNKKKIEITAEQKQALTQVTNLRTLIEGLRDQEVDIKVQAKLSDLLADLAKVDALIASIPDQKNVTVNIKQNVDTAVARITSRLREMEGSIGRLDKTGPSAFRRLESAGAGIGGVFGSVSTAIRRLPPLLQGVTLVITAALIPAILALGAALAGAVAGLTALATAFAAALGPSVLLIIGFFQRFGAILKARQQEQQALAAETKKSAAATLQQAQADERARDASRAVTTATVALTRARNDYARAIQETKEEIAQAARDEAEANRNLIQATQDLRTAAVDAYEEMRRAALDAADAVLQVQQAELGVERGKLNIRKAALELRKFRREAGLGAGSLDALFKRSTDITIDPAQARKAIGAIVTAGEDLTEEQAIRLRELILNLKDAKLQEKGAIIGVKRAQLDENDAKRKAADFAKNGISASDSYKAAIDRLRGAQQTANEAIRKSNELQAEGIRNNPRVISARRSVADAEDAVANAKHNQALAILEAAAAQEQQTDATNKYNEARKKLSKTERDFLDLIDRLAKSLRNTLGPATDEVFKGIIESLGLLTPAIAGTKGDFKSLGTAWGNLIRDFTRNLIEPGNAAKLQQFFRDATPLVTIFSSILQSLSDIFINLATAAMPQFLALASDFAIWLDGLSTKSANIQGLADAIEPMVQVIRDFASAGVDLVLGIVNVFTAAQGPITEFTGWLADAAKQFLEWTQSEEGRKQIRDFFERTLPMAEDFLDDLFKLVVAFLQLEEAAAPVIRFLLRRLGTVLDVLNDILTVIADVSGVFQEFFDWLSGTPAGPILDFFTTAFVSPLAAIKGAVQWLIKHIPDIPTPKVPKFLQGAWSFGKRALGFPTGAAGGIATRAMPGIWGEAGPEALIPLTKGVLGALGKAIVAATSGMLPSMSGRIPAVAGGGMSRTVVNHNHFHIPHPLDSSKAIDPENTAALLQQAWERRGGGWH